MQNEIKIISKYLHDGWSLPYAVNKSGRSYSWFYSMAKKNPEFKMLADFYRQRRANERSIRKNNFGC